DRLQKANITVSEPAELEGEHAEISYVQQKLTDSMEKAAVRQLVVYLLATQKRSLAHLQVAESFEIGQYLQMANTVQRNLELTQSATTGRKQGSLFWVLDKTTTAMGGRLLKQWLSRPLLSLDRIKQRQQMVQALLDDYFTRENIVDSLKGVYDLERLSGRVAFGNVNPRELLQLAKSLEATKLIIQTLAESGNPDLEKYGQGIDPQSELAESITNCLVDQPPISAKDGGIIRAGVSEDLDKYREAMNGGKKWLAQMEMEERQRTGIDNLKIGYNRVFGYFIQVSKGNVAKVPQDRYTRKQTLTNAERYITPELKEHENLILEAESRSTDLEYELFSQLREAVKAHIPDLQELGRQLAALDVFVAFAQDAEEKNYCRPSFSSKNEIAVKNGRHPVVEAVLPAGSYIPNDLVMDEDTSIYLITGPNM
ncbi:MAG: DNA mismatch repair protein MutS, partial [Lactobacillus delbrueckii]